jgi:hypothetical protein
MQASNATAASYASEIHGMAQLVAEFSTMATADGDELQQAVQVSRVQTAAFRVESRTRQGRVRSRMGRGTGQQICLR